MNDLPGTRGSRLSENCATEVIDCLQRSSILTLDGALDLYVDRDKLQRVLDVGISATVREDYLNNRDSVLTSILRSRYHNLRNLLGETVSEAEYLGIVRNQILVDIQGGDLLFQIFTSNILQRNLGEEAPFLEFIQRVCSKDVLKPGCGGFGKLMKTLVFGHLLKIRCSNFLSTIGIRNFLTLFLSIEVSKAMQEVAEARNSGDVKRQRYAQKMVDYFTDQMNESNPILTQISEAMTDEGICVDKLADMATGKNFEEICMWQARLSAATERKNAGNTRLMECSSRYNDMMKSLRESR